MTNNEMERRITAYRPRKAMFAKAFLDGATLLESNPGVHGGRCEFCSRKEDGGGLLTYRLRCGDLIFAGGRCAQFMDYLNSHPPRA
jgi:hypothetical protein